MGNLLRPEELNHFVNNANEFVLNAYEHGNLRLTFDDKTELLENGKYEDELKERERWCKLKIFVLLKINNGRIILTVRDEGRGFDFERHLHMSESDLVECLMKPNGRGILMASKYFESVKYNTVGNEVTVTAKLDS